ncbi:perforin-1-like [Lacerta agilis]|uniref:perforin-1-like n=1 Tax=Lacerta agilis TaxID=80427 RepID=UPI0014198B76|nr:perforin-1-like [Lacerta agilis]
MSKKHLFLAAFLLFLFQLPPTTSSDCHQHHRSICMKQDTFVPGHTNIGQGVDITTLERKGAFVVDTSQWQGPNGMCILCRNHLMKGQLQKLPLAVADWQVVRSCHRQESSSVEHLDVDVANAMATEVKNDWKADLGLGIEMNIAGLELPKMRVAFAGSHSRMAIYAHGESRQDSYSFVRQEVSCTHYRLRLPHRPSPLSSHFARHVAELPMKNSEEYQHFIDSYGTHYISQVELGARVRHLLAVQTCKMALWGVTASSIQDCLKWEFSLGSNRVFGPASQNATCEKIWKLYSRGISHEAYAKRHTEVVGGDKQMEILFSKAKGTQLFSAWENSAKAKPGLVSYSLLPLHTLLNHQDPRRGLLKQAIAGHINRKALKRDCPQQCPRWSSQSSAERCTCLCPMDGLNNIMCCARERGRAHLTFVVTKGSNLWGDRFSPTDAYVRVVFQGQALSTSIVTSDNPRWDETLSFGTVMLKHENPFHIEVWDTDGWGGDELLQRCTGKLEARAGAQWYRCSPQYGYIQFYYFLECGHTLSGPTCQDYVPLQLPTSYFN